MSQAVTQSLFLKFRNWLATSETSGLLKLAINNATIKLNWLDERQPYNLLKRNLVDQQKIANR